MFAREAAVALVESAPDDVDLAAPFLEPVVMRSELDRDIARGFLWGAAAIPKKRWEKVAERWAPVAAPLLGGPLDTQARDVLNRLSESSLAELLASGPKVPSRARWVERYEAGEHDAVWRELRAAGPRVRETEAAARVAKLTMKRLRTELERVVGVLEAGGCKFRVKSPVSAPPKRTARDLDAIEAALGSPLPLSFRAFHEEFGDGVDLTHDATARTNPHFTGLSSKDPLQVAPASVTRDFAVKEVARTSKQWAEALRRPPTLFLALGRERKEDLEQQDGSPYTLEVSGHAADGVVRRRPARYFVDYLRATLASGGFAELDSHPYAGELRALLTANRIGF
jgi:hypothetical protein